MRSVVRSPGLTIAAMGILALAACADTLNSGSGSGSDIKPVEGYHSIEELAAASPLVIVATVTGNSRVERVEDGSPGGLPFTVTETRIDELLRGRLAEPTLWIRQTGTKDNHLENDPILTKGERALLFLQPFELVRGTPAGQWVIAGIYQGRYVRDSAGRFVRRGPDDGLAREATTQAVRAIRVPTASTPTRTG